MKNKIFRISISTVVLLSSLMLSPLSSAHADFAFAEDLDGAVTYTKTFTISAYYSPLPCQTRYATGSYDGDIRLNGNGTNGADGTPVYPGMIAAPKTYEFGTKMDIPGVGIVAVHDRGGAIKAADGVVGVYDRLDIWMGYGDQGLVRALNWGKRTVEVVVYGVNDQISEQVTLSDYSADESSPGNCVAPTPTVTTASSDTSVSASTTSATPASVPTPAPIETVEPTLTEDLKLGDSGDEVALLQEELKNLNFFKGQATAYYGEVTEHAVFKFQQSQGLVGDRSSAGAGVFGPKTRDRMKEILASRTYSTVLITQSTQNYQTMVAADPVKVILISNELEFGMVSDEVASLQQFLKDAGYFEGKLITNYFGPVTQEAVLKFQLDNSIVLSIADTGAGRVGPSTISLINSLITG